MRGFLFHRAQGTAGNWRQHFAAVGAGFRILVVLRAAEDAVPPRVELAAPCRAGTAFPAMTAVETPSHENRLSPAGSSPAARM